jgi:hypothetical protein
MTATAPAHLGQSSRRNAETETGEADGSGCPSTSESRVTAEQSSIANRRKAPCSCEPADAAARPTSALTSTTKVTSLSRGRGGPPQHLQRQRANKLEEEEVPLSVPPLTSTASQGKKSRSTPKTRRRAPSTPRPAEGQRNTSLEPQLPAPRVLY